MQNQVQLSAIEQLMNRFEIGDMSLLDYVSDDVDLAIEHYRDSTDTSWQRCQDKQGFMALLTKLGSDVFPQGTNIIQLNTVSLGQEWYQSLLVQEFWYGVESRKVKGSSIIISHEDDGKVDYFREIVQSVIPI